MSRLSATLTIAGAALALSSCAMSGGQANADALTPEQLAVLDRNLGGKEAGEPISCLPASGRDFQTIRVSDNILLYRQSGRVVYRNDLRGGCPGLASDRDVLVFRNTGTSSCRGDIFTLVDRTSGIRGGACVLGEFTPYRTPRGAD
jgi:hypothetical protein